MSHEKSRDFMEAMQLAKKREAAPLQQLVSTTAGMSLHTGPANAWSDAISSPADPLSSSANSVAAQSWFTAVNSGEPIDAKVKWV